MLKKVTTSLFVAALLCFDVHGVCKSTDTRREVESFRREKAKMTAIPFFQDVRLTNALTKLDSNKLPGQEFSESTLWHRTLIVLEDVNCYYNLHQDAYTPKLIINGQQWDAAANAGDLGKMLSVLVQGTVDRIIDPTEKAKRKSYFEELEQMPRLVACSMAIIKDRRNMLESGLTATALDEQIELTKLYRKMDGYIIDTANAELNRRQTDFNRIFGEALDRGEDISEMEEKAESIRYSAEKFREEYETDKVKVLLYRSKLKGRLDECEAQEKTNWVTIFWQFQEIAKQLEVAGFGAVAIGEEKLNDFENKLIGLEEFVHAVFMSVICCVAKKDEDLSKRILNDCDPSIADKIPDVRDYDGILYTIWHYIRRIKMEKMNSGTESDTESD
ncbi:MAG: hypothetical protein LBB21_00580 [Holosporaceae bacterium]|jgi:hypothetical protein|nr:hypothetical protein [Holosporaceae bacterium]